MASLLAAGGARLHYEIAGRGPLAILVHGGTGTGDYDWERLREPLRREMRVLSLDLRGHGRSDDPTDLLGIEQIAEDLLALIEHLGERPASLIAFSIGATAALRMLTRVPEAARTFVAIGASRIGDPARAPEFAAGPWPAELIALRHEHGTGEDHWRSLRARLAGSWGSLRIDLDELAAMRTPTLVVCGDRDRIEPVERACEIARALPHGELLVVPACGHFVPRERPAELLAALRPFLGRHLG
jgi:pimeloyl-ACP methyl ester carboxylesterase